MKKKVLSTRVYSNKDLDAAYDLAVGAEAIIEVENISGTRKLFLLAMFSSEVPEILEVRLSSQSILEDLINMEENIKDIDAVCFEISDSNTVYNNSEYKYQLEKLMKLIKKYLEEINYYERGWKSSWIR